MIERYLSPDSAEGGGDALKADDTTVLTVDIDGEKFTVDQIREFKQGHMRQEDYTKKTQELAKHVQTLDEFREILEMAEDDPEEAVRQFQAAVKPPQKGDKGAPVKSDAEVKRLNKRIDEISVRMERDNVLKDEKLGPVLTKHENAILDLAIDRRLSIRDAAIIWAADNPKEVEAVTRKAGERGESTEPGRRAEGRKDFAVGDFVKSGDIAGAYKRYSQQ